MAVTLPKDDVRYKVGIDVGLNSIGFCAVEVDDDDQPIRLYFGMMLELTQLAVKTR